MSTLRARGAAGQEPKGTGNGRHRERPAPLWAVTLMLLVSGGCALIFQVVWMREFRLVFGATTASSAAVLAIFMAGLGLGSGLLGRWMDNSLRPMRLYGLLEAGIAVSAGLSPFLIGWARWAHIELGGQSALGPGAATVVRLSASAAILALPTFLMGGTMPAAARAVSVDADLHRRGAALLYGLNTVGAVAGAGLANFLLLEAVGSRAVLWLACLVNLLLAATALHLSARLCNSSVNRARRRRRESSAPVVFQEQLGRVGIAYFTAAIAGFAFFLMEIVWYRMLGPLLGGTTYTFGLILCLALLGIGLGGAVYSFAARWVKPSLQLLAATCAVEACFTAIPFWYGDRVAMWVLRQQRGPVASFGDQMWNWFEIGAFVILPASIVAGFQFPLLIAIAGTARRNVGKHVGLTYAANTMGAICGSLAGGFLLLPILTAPGVWAMAVWVLIGLAGVVVIVGGKWAHPYVGLATATSLIAAIAVFQEGPTAVWRHSEIGAGRAEIEGAGRNAEKKFMNATRRRCIWQAEGVESSVAITATDSLSFLVNGKNDGNACSDAATQIGLGLLGALLHESPGSGLVIGLGTGESAGWMADVRGIRRVDVVELEPVVVRMAERCASVNRDVLSNPKVHLHYNDAREFLLTAKTQYDLIASEPSNPYRAGIADLYTREFYESVSDRLAADGLFLQWLQAYEVDDRTVQIVLRTLRSVFPYIEVWATKPRDMVLVCGKSAGAFSYDARSLRERMIGEPIQQGLSCAWRVRDIEGVLAHFVCGIRTIDVLLDRCDTPLNTDDRNILEYAFAKTLGRRSRFSIRNLQLLAIQNGDDCPIPTAELNVEKLSQRRLAMHLYFGGTVPVDQRLSATQRIRAEAYNHYLARRYSDAAEHFKRIDVDTTCSIETLAYAHTLAELGFAAPHAVQEALNRNNAGESAAVKAIFHWRRGRKDQAVESILATFERLKRDPWGSSQLFDAVLHISSSLADVDPTAALRVYEQLERPLAMYRMEDKRLVLRYLLSEKLNSKYTVEAIESLEPNVPWTEWFLENRARIYVAVRHPLAGAARRDLQQFQAWAGRRN